MINEKRDLEITDSTLSSKGIAFIKKNLFTVSVIGETLRTSLGPFGKDKLIVQPPNQRENNSFVITNDGSKILKHINIENPIGRCIVALSASQDKKVGDGTTSIVVFAGSLATACISLLDRGMSPFSIIRGFQMALDISLQGLEEMSICIPFKEDRNSLNKIASVPLCSKIVSHDKERLGDLCVEAVLSVWNHENNSLDMERIRFQHIEGGSVKDTRLYKGIVLRKRFSHENMPKIKQNAIIAVLSFPLEVQRPKNQYIMNISDVTQYDLIKKNNQDYFQRVIDVLIKSGVNVVICQWGFDPEMNSMLCSKEIAAITWVSGEILEDVALSTGANICSRIDQLSTNMLGRAEMISEIIIGNSSEEFVVIEGCKEAKSVTFMIRGNSRTACEETSTSLIDSICVTRNALLDNRILIGGGSTEIELYNSISSRLNDLRNPIPPLEQYGIRAWANALLSIPLALAENAGLSPSIDYCSNLIKDHLRGEKHKGVSRDEHQNETKTQEQIWEPFALKCSILKMTKETVCMLLKIDDIITNE